MSTFKLLHLTGKWCCNDMWPVPLIDLYNCVNPDGTLNANGMLIL